MTHRSTSLRSVNLNLIPMLQALLREGSVVRAAAVLGLSRSATSEALGRLRETLGDPLLVPVGRGMALTPHAAELIGPVEELCARAEWLLQQASFDPATSARDFVIATSDYGVALAAPHLLALSKAEAPSITVDFVDASHDIAERLAGRQYDFAILARFYLEDMDSAALRFSPLARHRLVAVMRSDHPLATGVAPTIAEFENWPLITIMPKPGIVEQRRIVQVYGMGRFAVVMRIPHVTLIPELVRTSDCWAILPDGIAYALVAQQGLAQRELPSDPHQASDMCLVWSIVRDADPAHRWFRESLIVRCNASV